MRREAAGCRDDSSGLGSAQSAGCAPALQFARGRDSLTPFDEIVARREGAEDV